ncbi:MAG: hypothetical protein IJW28_04670 [Clostridia bacterium]|nr:hypothetical protein [Clostridia bacterium]
MKRKNSELKMLANLAKKRLLHTEYVAFNDTKENKNIVTASSYFITNAKALRRLKAETEYVKITDSIDSGFVKSVVNMLSQDNDVYNPLGRLSDNDYFQSLSDIEKQFYILNLSDKYTSIKTMFDTNKLDMLKIS